MNASQRKGHKISVKAELLGGDGEVKRPPLAAYVFSSGGRLLHQFDLQDGDGESGLDAVDESELYRVIAGPRLDIEDEGQLLTELVRMQAPEHRLRSTDLLAKPVTIKIDPEIWPCWILGLCVVNGTLVRRTTRDGIAMDLPVCDAEVEIYEVDRVPIIIGRIPDDILDRLRRLIQWPPPPPWPPVDGGPIGPRPGPGPDPGPLMAALSEIRNAPSWVSAVAATEDLDAPVIGDPSIKSAPIREFLYSGDRDPEMSPAEAAASIRALAAEPTVSAAAIAGTTPFRNAVIANPDLVRPILCWLWPTAVTTRLIGTAWTDACGQFRTVLFRGCDPDAFDLYFKAYRTFGFWRIPVYAPTPISCYTWWDYRCGTQVRLVSTSPFASTCAPCPPIIAPPYWVLAMAVGNTSLAHVRGASSALASTTDPSNVGLTDTGAPFGGYLRLRFEFDNSLLAGRNVHYYRVSWRKVGTGNPFVPLTDTVLRHYLHVVPGGFVIDPWLVGPKSVGSTTNLYEMPPALPPAGQWVTADAVVDTTSAGFEAAFAPPADAGLFDFRLDLFDTAGNQVNATALGISYRVPTTFDLTTTIQTEDASVSHLVTPGGSLVLRLHIDNNPCSASIAPPQLGTVVADPTCGLLDYPSRSVPVTLGFTASHPNGFATYQFTLVRGATALPMAGDSGRVGPAPGSHTLAPTVGFLLGTCDIAGFAESLRVTALATDGWNQQSQYDAQPLPRAFVLSPVASHP